MDNDKKWTENEWKSNKTLQKAWKTNAQHQLKIAWLLGSKNIEKTFTQYFINLQKYDLNVEWIMEIHEVSW